MSNTTRTVLGLLTVALMLCWALPATTFADEALDKAFEALKTYEWGTDRGVLKPIDDAVVASHGDAAARAELEKRLAAALAGDVPQAGKDYICRKLSLIGTAECVPTVGALLTDEKLSHMSRYALERIPDEAAVAAMRDALPKVKGKTKVGVINSLGVRRDAASAAALTALLKDPDKEVAAAAAAALGAIGNQDAAKALAAFVKSAPDGLKLAAADAYLACAEQLLAAGKRSDALAIYKALNTPDQPDHVQIAAKRGLLAAMKSN
jgi:HEAT repeat protein